MEEGWSGGGGREREGLTVSPVLRTSGGVYTLEVTNDYGTTVSSGASVVVREMVRITKQPEGLVVKEGEDAVLSVECTGEGPLRVMAYMSSRYESRN